jgi:hypothetical protein
MRRGLWLLVCLALASIACSRASAAQPYRLRLPAVANQASVIPTPPSGPTAPAIAVAIGNATAAEGSGGATVFAFAVTLSAPSDAPVSVGYDTADGTATIADQDYSATSGRLVFDPGQTEKSIAVDVAADATPERDETFTLVLSSPLGAELGGTVVDTVTIANDDFPPLAERQAITADSGAARPVTLSGADVESCELAFSIVDGPSHGTLSAVADAPCATGQPNTDSAVVTYTPAAGYVGPDGFTFKVGDGGADSGATTVEITVRPVDDPPAAAPRRSTTDPPSRSTLATARTRTAAPRRSPASRPA